MPLHDGLQASQRLRCVQGASRWLDTGYPPSFQTRSACGVSKVPAVADVLCWVPCWGTAVARCRLAWHRSHFLRAAGQVVADASIGQSWCARLRRGHHFPGVLVATHVGGTATHPAFGLGLLDGVRVNSSNISQLRRSLDFDYGWTLGVHPLFMPCRRPVIRASIMRVLLGLGLLGLAQGLGLQRRVVAVAAADTSIGQSRSFRNRSFVSTGFFCWPSSFLQFGLGQHFTQAALGHGGGGLSYPAQPARPRSLLPPCG